MSVTSGESITQFPAKKKQWLPFTTNEEVSLLFTTSVGRETYQLSTLSNTTKKVATYFVIVIVL